MQHEQKSRYFVSYAHQFGFGNCEIEPPNPVCGIEDVRGLAEAMVKQYGLTGVIVLFWQRFEV